MIALAKSTSIVGIDWLQPQLAEARRWQAPRTSVPRTVGKLPHWSRLKIEHGIAGGNFMASGGRWSGFLANTYYVLATCAILAGAISWLIVNAGYLYQQFSTQLAALRAGDSGWFLAAVATHGRVAVIFVVTFAVLAIPSYAVLRVRRSLRRILRASGFSFNVAAEFSGILINLTECVAEVRAGSGKLSREILEKFLKEQKPALSLLLNQIAQ